MFDGTNIGDDGSQADLEGTVTEDDNEENNTTRRRACRNSKRVGTSSNPTTLKHYSQTWQPMLVVAKNYMRRHVALINAFPERDNNLNEAGNILIKTITEYREEFSLDDSKFFYCYIVTDFVILYIGHEVNRDMAILVGL